jgi:CheY-like chemotaxis protein
MMTLRAPNVRVLVVDDDEFALNVACGLLKSMEIKTRTVNCGAMALKAVTNGKYEIVFIDHLMPEMDGIETMQKIRELGGHLATLPLVALTGSGQENAREMFISKGFSDYLSKPINMEELCSILKAYLPPDKIEMQAATAVKQVDLKIAATFVKEKRNVYTEIMNSLNSGDTKTAHRAAHSLKTAAGYLSKKELSAAAFSLETSLGKEPPEYTKEQLAILESELSAALAELEPLLAEEEAGKQEAVQVSNDEFAAILAELTPLLQKSDFGASAYVDKLRTIAGMTEIAELIENYEFSAAYSAIQKYNSDKMVLQTN